MKSRQREIKSSILHSLIFWTNRCKYSLMKRLRFWSTWFTCLWPWLFLMMSFAAISNCCCRVLTYFSRICWKIYSSFSLSIVFMDDWNFSYNEKNRSLALLWKAILMYSVSVLTKYHSKLILTEPVNINKTVSYFIGTLLNFFGGSFFYRNR